MREAIEAGVRAAVVFDFCRYEGDGEPVLLQCLKDMAREADFPVCGGNGMGFYNFESRTFASFQEPVATTPGYIAALCHSGSVFGMLADASGRYRFNLLTSQDQEIEASLGEYMDYALELPSTRVLALFVEAIREPEGFVAALEKASRRGVPVVAVKVGRTAESARLAATHASAPDRRRHRLRCGVPAVRGAAHRRRGQSHGRRADLRPGQGDRRRRPRGVARFRRPSHPDDGSRGCRRGRVCATLPRNDRGLGSSPRLRAGAREPAGRRRALQRGSRRRHRGNVWTFWNATQASRSSRTSTTRPTPPPGIRGSAPRRSACPRHHKSPMC